MTDFLIITGMILWCIATLGVACLGFLLAVESYGFWQGFACIAIGLTLAACSSTGIYMTADANGWLKDSVPPDGCYQIYRNTELMPISTGKTVAVVPYENVNYKPIQCPR